MGVIMAWLMTPMLRPRLATISATSPRQAMPAPTWAHSIPRKPHSRAPRPQPMTLDKMAVASSSSAKTASCPFRGGSSTLTPMPAKNTGVSSR